jgi:exonuclease VII large subunit
MPDVSYGELVASPERLGEPAAPTAAAGIHVPDLIEALRDAEARAGRHERAIRWWAARFESQVARAAQAEARATRVEEALDHTCERAIHAEQELEAAEAALCREHTPIFDGPERLSISARIRWLGDRHANAGEPAAGNAALRGAPIDRS